MAKETTKRTPKTTVKKSAPRKATAKKTDNVKNNFPLIALLLILIGGVVGGTLAYFTSEATFENLFKTNPYTTEFYEEFESPENWTPGTETNKEVFAKNNSDIDIAVRVSFTERWEVTDVVEGETAGTLDGNITVNGQTERAAIINFDKTSQNWIDNTAVDGHYYYYQALGNGEVTTNFIDSVTFNPDVVNSQTCTKSDDGLKVTCVSDANGYDGATYTLTVKVETVQFDAYSEVWTSAPTIAELSE